MVRTSACQHCHCGLISMQMLTLAASMAVDLYICSVWNILQLINLSKLSSGHKITIQQDHLSPESVVVTLNNPQKNSQQPKFQHLLCTCVEAEIGHIPQNLNQLNQIHLHDQLLTAVKNLFCNFEKTTSTFSGISHFWKLEKVPTVFQSSIINNN